MEVSHTNTTIPCPGSAEEDEQLILMDTFSRRMKGKADTEPKLPPLPLEKELFIPPVERGNRAERSILVLTEIFLGMMPQEGREVMKIKETAIIMKTSIKRIYTICNVLEGIRLMVRTDMNMYEWQGRRVLMPTLMLLRQMAEKQNMKEKLNMASIEKLGVVGENVSTSLPDKNNHLNICMMTQNLLMMFLVLPQPKVLSLSVASTIMHGAGQAANRKRGSLQKLLNISKILQGLGIVRNVKVTMATDEVVFAYQYVGQEVELVTLIEEVIGSSEKDLEEDSERRRSEYKVDTDDVNEVVCRVEERRDGTAELKQPRMMVVKVVRKKMVRLKFFGDEVDVMGDCSRRKRKMK